MSNDTASTFFDDYRRALLARDVDAIAGHYAVPALIEFPDQAIAVSDPAQTREFFEQAVGQYENVTTADTSIDVVAETGHSIWADVTWTYDAGAPSERSMYQLVRTDGDWKIAVLTPLGD